MNALSRSLSSVLVAVLLVSAPHVHAGIDKAPGAGFQAALLKADAEQFIDAMIKVAKRRGTDATVTKYALERLRKDGVSSTLARMEYTWEADGTARTAGRIVVHSRSGQPIETVLGSTRAGPSSGQSSSSFAWTDEQMAREVSEAGLYPNVPGHIRATSYRVPDSVLAATDRPGEAAGTAAGDAELKALQSLEAQIKAGTIPRGGTLTGTVSKDICVSCETNIERFSDAYGVNGKIYYLVEPQAEAAAALAAAPEERQLIADSAESNRSLYRIRNGYVKSRLKGNPTEWTLPEDYPWAVRRDVAFLAEAEAGSLTANERCLP
jgi:hypothetical protein